MKRMKKMLALLLATTMLVTSMPVHGFAEAKAPVVSQALQSTMVLDGSARVNGAVTASIGRVTYDVTAGNGATVPVYTINSASDRIRCDIRNTVSFQGTISAPEGEEISWVRMDVFDAMTGEPYTVGESYYYARNLKQQQFDLASVPALNLSETIGNSDYAFAEGGKYIVMFCAGGSKGSGFADTDAHVELNQGPAVLLDIRVSPENCTHPHASYRYVSDFSGETRAYNYGDPLTHQVEPRYERYCGLCDSYLMDIWGEGTPEEHTLVDGVCEPCGYAVDVEKNYIRFDESYQEKEENFWMDWPLARTISVDSNTDWTVSSKEEWILLDGDGIGNAHTQKGSFTIKVAKNESGYNRYGEVHVQADGCEDLIIPVSQGHEPYAWMIWDEFYDGQMQIKHNEPPMTIEFISNAVWKVSPQTSEWITVTPVSGSGDGAFNVVFEENTTGEKRWGSLQIDVGSDIGSLGGETQAIGFCQDPAPEDSEYKLSVDNGTINGLVSGCEGGQGMTINVTSNTDWTVSSNVDWVYFDDNTEKTTVNGSGDGPFTVYVKANPSGQPQREGTIYVSADGCETIEIKIVQTQRPSIDNYAVSSTTVSANDVITLSGIIDGNGTKLKAVQVSVFVHDNEHDVGAVHYRYEAKSEDDWFDQFDLSRVPGIVVGSKIGESDFVMTEGAYDIVLYATNVQGEGFVKDDTNPETPPPTGTVTVGEATTCTHPAYTDVYDPSMKIQYTDNGDGTHTWQNGFNRICDVCKETIDRVYGEENTADHDFTNGNVCICGYDRANCQHIPTPGKTTYKWHLIEQIDGDNVNHMVKGVVYEETCSMCGSTYLVEVKDGKDENGETFPYSQKHDYWKEGKCGGCEYTCVHEFQDMYLADGNHKAENGIWESKGEDGHWCASIEYWQKCTNCGLEQKYTQTDPYKGETQPHEKYTTITTIYRYYDEYEHQMYTIEATYCGGCNWKKVEEKPADYRAAHVYENGICLADGCGAMEPIWSTSIPDDMSYTEWYETTRDYSVEEVNEKLKELYDLAYEVYSCAVGASNRSSFDGIITSILARGAGQLLESVKEVGSSWGLMADDELEKIVEMMILEEMDQIEYEANTVFSSIQSELDKITKPINTLYKKIVKPAEDITKEAWLDMMGEKIATNYSDGDEEAEAVRDFIDKFDKFELGKSGVAFGKSMIDFLSNLQKNGKEYEMKIYMQAEMTERLNELKKGFTDQRIIAAIESYQTSIDNAFKGWLIDTGITLPVDGIKTYGSYCSLVDAMKKVGVIKRMPDNIEKYLKAKEAFKKIKIGDKITVADIQNLWKGVDTISSIENMILDVDGFTESCELLADAVMILKTESGQFPNDCEDYTRKELIERVDAFSKLTNITAMELENWIDVVNEMYNENAVFEFIGTNMYGEEYNTAKEDLENVKREVYSFSKDVKDIVLELEEMISRCPDLN